MYIRRALLLSLVLFVSPPVFAGVVMELVGTNPAGDEVSRMTFYVDGQNIRMDRLVESKPDR